MPLGVARVVQASDLHATQPPREVLPGERVVNCASDDPVVERSEFFSQLPPGPGAKSREGSLQQAPDVVVTTRQVRIVVVEVHRRVPPQTLTGIRPSPERTGNGTWEQTMDALEVGDLTVGRNRETSYDGRPPAARRKSAAGSAYW
jgi:hypothetical protein